MGQEYIEVNDQEESNGQINASVDIKLVDNDTVNHFDFDVCILMGIDMEGNTVCINEVDDSPIGHRRCMLIGQALGILEVAFSELNIIERKTALAAKAQIIDHNILGKEIDEND